MSDWDWEGLRPLLFVCALLIAPALTVWDGWSYVQLNRDGVTAPAVVAAKDKRTSRRSTSYYVEYRFRDAYDRRRSGRQEIDRELFARLHVNQRIDIVYSRSNPDLNVAYMEVLRERLAFLSFVSLVIAIMAGGIAWWWHYAVRKTEEHDAEMRRTNAA